MAATEHETVFTLEATPVKFGPGAAADAGWELRRLGVRRALLVSDPGVVATGAPDRVRASIEAEGIEVVVYDRARVEPMLESFEAAAAFAKDAGVDGFVSVGGGSSMDTAKVANLIVSHPAPVMAYVNPPIGEGRKPPSPLRPHLAIPTTSGTGAEATTVAVLDIPELRVKTGISHRYMRCSQAIEMNAPHAPYSIPVPWFAVTHPRGTVVIDGGNAAECATDAKGRWGAVTDVYWPAMRPEQACVPQLEAAGIDPAGVAWILQSHLHLDHTGAVAALASFPNAKVLATRTEYEYGHAPDWFADGGYIRADYVKPGVPWVLLEETDDGYDLYGDGVVRMRRTPGHAPGHQSFEITLPSGSVFLLTVDAAYTMAHWNEEALPGFLASAVDAVRSVKKLHRIAERSGATVVTGHDPDAWPGFKQAPAFYD